MRYELKPYPSYKDSGVPWLGEVPQHWEVYRLKNKVWNVVEQTSTAQPSDLYIALEHVESWTGRLRLPKGEVVFDSQVKRFRGNDVIFGKLRPYLAKVTLTPRHGVCVGEFFVLRPKVPGVKSAFLVNLLRSKHLIDAVNGSTFGAKMPRANWIFVGNLPSPFPPVSEQDAIVRFLDHVDRRIRRYIRAKRQLIALLNEQRQAIIHRAVTRGLDPDVRLKPSGIVWLPEIPEHWIPVRLGALAASLQTGPFGSQLHAHDYRANGTPVINPSHMKHGKIIEDSNCAVGSEKVSELARHRLRRGDIVFARRGALGRCALVSGKEAGWLCGTGSLRMRLKSHVANPEYLLQLFLSRGVGEWLSLHSVGSTMENLNTGILARLPLPLPPMADQFAIVNYVRKQGKVADNAIALNQSEIDLIREYRTRLIADVVTGKLDVREAAARLFEEADDDASEDALAEELAGEAEADEAEPETA